MLLLALLCVLPTAGCAGTEYECTNQWCANGTPNVIAICDDNHDPEEYEAEFLRACRAGSAEPRQEEYICPGSRAICTVGCRNTGKSCRSPLLPSI